MQSFHILCTRWGHGLGCPCVASKALVRRTPCSLPIRQTLNFILRLALNGNLCRLSSIHGACAGLPHNLRGGIASIMFQLPIVKHNYAWAGCMPAGDMPCPVLETYKFTSLPDVCSFVWCESPFAPIVTSGCGIGQSISGCWRT